MDQDAQDSKSVFIGYGGQKSRLVAQALREWLRCLSPDIQPWLSTLDMPPGGLWPLQLANKLQKTRAGILCVTKDNTSSSWLNFEAGALSRSVETALVVPYAIDLDPSSIPTPIGHFQGVAATRRDTLRMVSRLFEALGADYDWKSNIFDAFWPMMNRFITAANTIVPLDAEAVETDLKKIEDTAVAQRTTDLKEVRISPTRLRAGDTLQLEYLVKTEAREFPVWLGAAVCGAEGKWFPRQDEDKEVHINIGVERHNRQLTVDPTIPPGDYDVNAEIWIGPTSDSRQSYAMKQTRRWPVQRIQIDS